MVITDMHSLAVSFYLTKFIHDSLPIGTNLKSGGVPPVIFQLKSLQELYLDNQGIQSIPADIENLSNLRVLSLTRCLVLQSIAAATGLLPNIKSKYIVYHCKITALWLATRLNYLQSFFRPL